jgi:hypothetical protein
MGLGCIFKCFRMLAEVKTEDRLTGLWKGAENYG